MKTLNRLSVVSVGQSLITHDLRHYSEARIEELSAVIRDADASFTNLEASIYVKNGWPTKENYLHTTPPVVLDYLSALGFNMLSLANNHCFDWGSPGILSTIGEVSKRPLACAGTGVDMKYASSPCYLETSKGRVGMIALTMGDFPRVLPRVAMATDATSRIPARPGANVVRIDTKYVVKKEDIKHLNGLRENLGFKLAKDNLVKTGRAEPDDELRIFGQAFIEGSDYSVEREINTEDLERNLSNIERAAGDCDVLLLSMHNHYWEPVLDSAPPWQREFAHRCVDAGATAILGHGVPMLLGIEIYRGSPIFYSLGNFFFHSRTVRKNRDDRIWESVIARMEFAGTQLEKIFLYPIILGGEESIVSKDLLHRIVPVIVKGKPAERILNRLAKLSGVFGTSVEVADGKGFVKPVH